MAKRKIMYSETYKKGIELNKEFYIKMLKREDTKLFAVKAGKFDDNKEFVTLTIEED